MDALWMLPTIADYDAPDIADDLTPFEALRAGDVIEWLGERCHVVYAEASALWLDHGYGWTVCHPFDALTVDERVRVTGWEPVGAEIIKSIERREWAVAIGE